VRYVEVRPMVDRAKHNIMEPLDLEEDSHEGVESITDQSSSTLDNEDDEDLLPRDSVLPAGPGQGLLVGHDQGLLPLDPVLPAVDDHGPDQGLLDPVLLAGPDQVPAKDVEVDVSM
jgi:hypothetical protein